MLDIPLYLHPFAVKEWNFHLNILFFFPSAQHTRSRHEWDLLSRFYTDDIGVRVDFSYPSTILIHLALARCPQPNFFCHLTVPKLYFFYATRDALCSIQNQFLF